MLQVYGKMTVFILRSNRGMSKSEVSNPKKFFSCRGLARGIRVAGRVPVPGPLDLESESFNLFLHDRVQARAATLSRG